MSMMQMLFFSAGTLTESPFNQNTPNKPLTSVISLGEENTLTFPIPAGVSNISVQAWGAGGASGGSVDGISGAGGGGGYVSAAIPVDELNINSLIIKVGGGGGNPTYYENDSTQYTTVNRANISFVGSNSVSSNPSYSTISQVGTAVSSVSSPSYSTITPLGSVSGENVTSLDVAAFGLLEGDIILVASATDTGPVNNTFDSDSSYIAMSTGTASVGYSLYYKRVAAGETITSITGLTGVVGTGDNARRVAHIVMAFRGVSSTIPFVDSTPPINTTTTEPSPPDAEADISGCTSVIFGFVDDLGFDTGVSVGGGYGPNLIFQRVNSGNANEDATVMAAYLSNVPGGTVTTPTFTTPNNDNTVAITVLLRPQQTLSPISGTMTIPGVQVNDVVLVSSVSDGNPVGGMNIPNAPSGPFASIDTSAAGGSPSYRVSWKRIVAADIDLTGSLLISNLNLSGTINGGPADGDPAGIAHAAMAFRGVITTGNPIVTNATNPSTSGTGDPDPPSIIANTINFASIAFGFINNISVGSITPPTNYTTLINQPVGTDSNGTTQATLMAAFRSLTVSGTENPLTFDTGGGTNDFEAVTVGLRPQTIITAVPNTIDLTTPFSANPLRENDIVLVASISDGGTMSLPANGYATLGSGSNNNQPAYQLSWKRMGPIPDTAVTGLSTTGIVQGGGNNGDPAGVAHVAIAFRGVSPTTNPRSVVGPAGDGAPNPPSIGSLNQGDAVVAFGLLDDRSVNATAGSANYTIARNQAVGTDATGNDEATIMSAYRLNITTASEDPPAFNSTGDNYVAASIALTPQLNNTFSANPGSCGGSGGGFSGVFYTPAGSPPGTLVPLLIAGGGGGGGGATVASSLPVGIIGGVPTGGNGGPGGGVPGGNGNAFVLNALSQYFYAGQGGGPGGDGIVSFEGGAGGLTYYFDGISILTANLTNSGENGTNWDSPLVAGFSTGGRGANSPSNNLTAIPLYGANGSGGWIRGSGGGSSRTRSTSVPVAVPSDCGGAGGSGYYGGGGGGSGAGGGGGGGGGGSNYVNVSLGIFVNANIAGIGTIPGSPIPESLVGYGGASITGTGSITGLGNPGQNGLIIISYVG